MTRDYRVVRLHSLHSLFLCHNVIVLDSAGAIYLFKKMNFFHLVPGRPVVRGLAVACKAVTCVRNPSDHLSTRIDRNSSNHLSTRIDRNSSDRLELSTRIGRNLSDGPADNLEPIDLRKVCYNEIKGQLNNKHGGNLNQVNITVLGTGGNELSPSFAVHANNMTYLFNLGEGWERLTLEHNRRIAKQLITFFTRSDWESCSGCLAVYQSLKSRQAQQDYIGPVKMRPLLNYTQRYTGGGSWNDRRSGVGYSQLKDENMTVSVIDVDPTGGVDDAGTVVAYSCKLSDHRGKFFTDKAIELGVSEKWAFSVLRQGMSVITKEGNLVHPHQVMAETRKGDSFLVVDCPSEYFMDAVTTNQYLQPEHYAKQDENLVLVVHITPLVILQHEDYCKWMASFGEGTKHIFLHSTVCPGEMGYRKSMISTLPFHMMNPTVYPLPCHLAENVIDKAELNVSKYVREDSIIIGRMLQKYHMKPKIRVDDSECLGDIEHAVKNGLSSIFQVPGLQRKILHHRNLLSVKSTGTSTRDKSINSKSMKLTSVMSSLTKRDSNLTLTDDPNDALITVLGTSASIASFFRGNSGILVQTPTAGNILLDCGEGTLCQLQRCFGVDTAREILRNINVIFISHFHTDHTFGLCRLLDEIGVLTASDPSHTVTLVTYEGISRNLKVNRVCKGLKLRHVSAYSVTKNPHTCGGDVSIETVPVKHIRHSFGCVLRKGSEWSIVYSGDTLPCKDLIEAGQDATLLIHEATFDDEYSAISGRHCTYSQAVDAGADMNAKFTLTTHFSTRQTWFPLSAKYKKRGTSPAIDFMTLRLSDLRDQLLDSDSCWDVFKTLSDSYV